MSAARAVLRRRILAAASVACLTRVILARSGMGRAIVAAATLDQGQVIRPFGKQRLTTSVFNRFRSGPAYASPTPLQGAFAKSQCSRRENILGFDHPHADIRASAIVIGQSGLRAVLNACEQRTRHHLPQHQRRDAKSLRQRDKKARHSRLITQSKYRAVKSERVPAALKVRQQTAAVIRGIHTNKGFVAHKLAKQRRKMGPAQPRPRIDPNMAATAHSRKTWRDF